MSTVTYLSLQDSGETRYMTRSDGSEGIVQIEHNTDEGRVELDTWLVVRKHLTNASQVVQTCKTFMRTHSVVSLNTYSSKQR